MVMRLDVWLITQFPEGVFIYDNTIKFEQFQKLTILTYNTLCNNHGKISLKLCLHETIFQALSDHKPQALLLGIK